MASSQMDLAHGRSEADAAALRALGTRLALEPGQSLFRMGTPADAVYVVERGRVALTLPLRIRDGEEEIVVEEKQAGETVGWSGLVPPHRFTLNASAAVASEVHVFARDALVQHFDAHPAVGRVVTANVAAVMGHRLQVFQTMWVREMQRTVEHRYA